MRGEVPDSITIDGATYPTMNSRGKPIAQTVEAIAAFWHFYATGPVDPHSGRPLLLFHGTNQDVATFDESRIGENTTAACSIAFFFSEDPREASEYAELAGRTQLADAIKIEKRVQQIKKDLAKAERQGDWDTVERLTMEWEDVELGAINADPSGQNVIPVYVRMVDYETLDMRGTFDGHAVAEAIEAAKRAGRDGLKLVNVFDPVTARPEGYTTTQWVVFRPEQIKSAISNPGSFDLNSPHLSDGFELSIGKHLEMFASTEKIDDEPTLTRRLRP